MVSAIILLAAAIGTGIGIMYGVAASTCSKPMYSYQQQLSFYANSYDYIVLSFPQVVSGSLQNLNLENDNQITIQPFSDGTLNNITIVYTGMTTDTKYFSNWVVDGSQTSTANRLLYLNFMVSRTI
jgi:GTPase